MLIVFKKFERIFNFAFFCILSTCCLFSVETSPISLLVECNSVGKVLFSADAFLIFQNQIDIEFWS